MPARPVGSCNLICCGTSPSVCSSCKRAVKYRVAGFLAVLAGTVWLEGGEHVGLPDLDDSASGS